MSFHFLTFPIPVLVNYKISKSFDKNIGFGLSLRFTGPIFINLLGFSNHEVIEKEGIG